jgi:hypothetical protein
MKYERSILITLVVLLATLAVPLRLAAQDLTAGTGTTNFVPIWTNSTTLGNSTIFETGGKVGIGNTSPAATLDVKGPNATTAGAAAPTGLKATGGKGGDSFSTPTKGGAGGAIQLTSGAGGRDTAALGGTGGTILITGGTGGSCIPLFAGCGLFAGNGGSIMLQPGAGGTGGASGQSGNVIVVPTGGRVGIGETNPGNTLEVKVGGTTLADHWTTRSSRRFKANIYRLEGALQKVERLQGVSYQDKTDGTHEIGLVAEDVNRVVPEVVSRDKDTHEVQGVDYSRLAALLIEAVKSQQVEIRQLKVRIEQLTSKASGK